MSVNSLLEIIDREDIWSMYFFKIYIYSMFLCFYEHMCPWVYRCIYARTPVYTDNSTYIHFPPLFYLCFSSLFLFLSPSLSVSICANTCRHDSKAMHTYIYVFQGDQVCLMAAKIHLFHT